MASFGNINIKVLLFDTDFYALQAVNSYLAWDRRTRVTYLAESLESMWSYLNSIATAELPDFVIMACDDLDAYRMSQVIAQLQTRIHGVDILCLSRTADPALVEVAANMHTRGFLLKQEVRLRIAWAIIYALAHDFVITQEVARTCGHLFNGRIFRATILPEQRSYPELTDRIRQAIKLSVVDGMPAHLAADEMGISLHTIRGYIKEGYRILEAYDRNDQYPVDMTPQERAFMRFTALADEEGEEDLD